MNIACMLPGHAFQKLVALLWKGQYFEVLARLCARYFPPGLIQLRKHYVMVLRERPASNSLQRRELMPRSGTNNDLPGILACSEQTASASAIALYRGFLGSGANCYVIDDASQVVAYSWLFRDKYTLTYDAYKTHSIHLILPARAAFVGNSFVHPDYRRRGLYSALLRMIADTLEWPCGTDQVFVAVESGNEASVTGHVKNGFAGVIALYYVALFGKAVVGVRAFSGGIRIYRLGSGLAFAVNETGMWRRT